MKPINVELTMGHNIGISASYYKPRIHEVLEDYLKAVDLLTIHGDKLVLLKQVTELKEKTKDNEYVIKAKLQEKDEAIQSMKEKYDIDITLLKEAITDMRQLLITDRLVAMFAPNVIGHNDAKLGLLRSMVGGRTDHGDDNGRRGRINSLLVGDPGTAKSILARESTKLIPNSRYLNAQNTSGKSLIGIVDRVTAACS
jgi:DNA replicative helicase MCM subunit Mcm2 (Cdc46/Mcm family)